MTLSNKRKPKKIKKKIKNLKVLVPLGPPGAGKGTQAELLANKFNLYHLETSKILEAHIMNARKGEYVMVKGKKYFLDKERKNWKTGILVSPPLTSFLMKKKIRELVKEGKGMVMSGSPRTLPEGKELVPFLKKLYGKGNIRVILLEISPKETRFRNSHRRICKLMRHPVLYSEETKNLTKCPLDGSKLVRRKGLDDPEIIKVRLKEYKERTLPLINYFKREKLKVVRVDGSPSPAIVFKNVLKAVR